MTLVFAYAVPVAATESEAAPAPVAMAEEVTPNAAPAASEDAQVQATYDAFEEMAAAYDSGDYAAMKAARETFWASQEEFTEAQTAEWENIIENTIGQGRYDTVTIDAGWLVDYFEPAYNAFSTEKNVHNAYDYVNVYEYMDWVDIDKFFADASALYAEAKPMSPTSENVIKVYETYEDMMFWFTNEGPDCTFFEEEFEAFEGLLEVYNEFTEDEFTQLAGLLEVADGEEAYYKILGDWILINVTVELNNLGDAFSDSYSADDAEAFVEYYDSIIDSEMFTEEELELVIYKWGFDDVYEEALWAIEQAADADKQDTTESVTTEGSDKSDKDTSPATGDDFNAAPYAALMVIAAAVAVLAVKRRKIQ
jgi:hypothetical protein